mmetsp:Transcript_6410/g.11087  ORF Transcript_6410/g.11087 Transcript_6410/m.11087 type:complete len:224 (-) Transcript_6410:322-993(-)
MSSRNCIRGTLIVANAIFLAFSAVIIGVGIYAWRAGSLRIVGRQLGGSEPIGYIVVGGFLAASSILGIISAKTTYKCFLFFYVVLLLIIFVVLTAASVAIFVIGGKVESGDQYWLNRLDQFWRSSVSQSPGTVCEFMDAFQCSGFSKSCTQYSQSEQPLYCPSSCSNLWSKDSCYDVTIHQIIHRFNIVAGVALGISFLIGVALVFTISLCCSPRKSERKSYV